MQIEVLDNYIVLDALVFFCTALLIRWVVRVHVTSLNLFVLTCFGGIVLYSQITECLEWIRVWRTRGSSLFGLRRWDSVGA